jgi:hypothetical protein
MSATSTIKTHITQVGSADTKSDETVDGLGVGVGVNDGLGVGVGVNDGLGVGVGVNDGLGVGVGVNDGLGVGAAARTAPLKAFNGAPDKAAIRTLVTTDLPGQAATGLVCRRRGPDKHVPCL